MYTICIYIIYVGDTGNDTKATASIDNNTRDMQVVDKSGSPISNHEEIYTMIRMLMMLLMNS